MAYPTSFDTFAGTTAQGTSLLTSPDHAADHRQLGSAVSAIEEKIGLGAGTPQANLILVGGVNSGTAQWGSVANNLTLGTPRITGGTIATATINTSLINSATLSTPTIGSIVVPGTVQALGFSAALAPGIGSVADAAGGTLTVNSQAGQVYYCAMGTTAGNRTVGTPLNPTGYQQLTYAFKASGSANGTLVWAGIFRFSQNAGTPALGTASTWNYYGWRYNPIDTKWDFMGQSLNVI